ncbi:MAG: RuBisCO large subunit C-terminal-like domain-containing protein [Firmicutes bacterium]|nr:RuBisCO large subunit C-terminal-like domain-containing protein [Bacillota bacterium]
MDRFSVVYRIAGSETEAYARAQDLCLEQTVEFPAELVPPGFIQDQLVGQIMEFVPDGSSYCRATISFAVDTAAHELTQLLNVIFGNLSIKPGYRVEEINLPESLLQLFEGPGFGKAGLRKLVNVPQRPLLFTALKPLGLSSEKLAELAYQFARGGIDIIKDDHGLTNQSFAPFEERVRLCAAAVERANSETGQNCIYVANVTAPHDEVMSRAKYAQENGAGGLLLAPGLVGFDTMRALAEDHTISLPVFSHPAFLGTYVLGSDNGISHFALFGQIMRLAGADGTIYPNYGGRFSFSRAECQSIVQGTLTPMGNLKPSFPCPGGGMSIDNIPDMIKVYGADVIFLIGGGLFKHGPNLIDNCKYFRSLVEGVS